MPVSALGSGLPAGSLKTSTKWKYGRDLAEAFNTTGALRRGRAEGIGRTVRNLIRDPGYQPPVRHRAATGNGTIEHGEAPAGGVCRKTPRVTGASPHVMISTPGLHQIVTERHITSSGNGQRRSPGRPPPAWPRAHPAAAGISHRAGRVRPGRPVMHPGPACQAAEG